MIRLGKPVLHIHNTARLQRILSDHSNDISIPKKIVVTARTKSSQPSSNSVFGSASDYFKTLRLRAANALTSSLPDEERDKLLEDLTPKLQSNGDGDDDDDGTTVPDRSIDEAIAVARAQEAERHRENWEKEKEKILVEAEQAARARVESDILIQKRKLAFEAWKEDLERDKQKDDDGDDDDVVVAAVNDDEKSIPKTTKESFDDHPILGPVLADLGHKRIYMAPAKVLSTIPVWKKQRTYRHSRAKAMASDKMKSLHLGLPGIIGIYESKDGSLAILDGQHRLGMLKVLQEKVTAPDEFDFDKILVEVYPSLEDSTGTSTEEEKHAGDLFLEVNKAEPVKLVDLPGVAKASHRKIINDGAALLMESFPDMFSPSQRCRAPHLNIDNLRDALFASNVIVRHSLKSAKAMETWMMEQNVLLSSKYQTEEGQQSVSATALKKAIKYDFYLGLDSSWLYN